ncbi:MAG: DNA topoisomerase IB [Chloroflexi bacterium]|nr:DNA topoisomerase IB [Chloroflexota bacterium]
MTDDVAATPAEIAEAAGLVYVSDTEPGIHRRRAGKGFTYWDADGQRITDVDRLARIKALTIPPAWTEVWICPDERGHIQATGRDAKGRKQYRYHPRWHERRGVDKFGRLVAFGEALPRIRERVETDLSLRGLPREKVLATVVKLLDVAHIRIGNREYARANHSFGLTTLRDKHVKINGSSLRFKFRGKSGKEHAINLKDRRLARIVKRCQEVPGQELFQYLDDDGKPQDIGSHDVNDYLREISGQDFTAKDFRTWGGTLLALQAFQMIGVCESKTQAKRNAVKVIHRVAEQLGNTPTVCKKYYVYPALVEAYLDDTLFERLASLQPTNIPGLETDEDVLIALVKTLEQ